MTGSPTRVLTDFSVIECWLRVRESRRRSGYHKKAPLSNVKGIDGRLAVMVKVCQDVDIGLPSSLGALPICAGIPGPSARRPPDDIRVPGLIPALNMSGRLYLELEARWGDEIKRIPFVSDAAEGDIERTRDDEFDESTARDVAYEVRTAPLPECEKVEREGGAVRVKLLGAGSTCGGKRRQRFRHLFPSAV